MFYSFAKGVLWFLFRLLFRMRISGLAHVPKEGPFILCANHIHLFDGPAMLAFSPRRLALMAKKELFRKKILAAIFRAAQVFPVDRAATADMEAYRHTLKMLGEGKGLLIFAQGTRMKAFENSKSGVAMFALKSGAPIVPVGISGRYRLFSRVYIKFGPPISMEPFAGRKIKSDLLAEVMDIVVPRITDLTK
ncbi:MAG: 1-acyl-sn-glycerol-3-phosphate acyltransferase [Defluviitaleaceae bacterium]|nr:1-acyl-sn-glycerol-3-phosphate acyltransferase [Defluviitaleaceae bacterium]MCL2238857.1 1-acyl-sn-glycerol-3-phosphate acyltransferase [Defluviitaleaceae bacterium]